MTTTPIYESVRTDLAWAPEELRPALDLDGLISASYDRPRSAPPAAKSEPALPRAARNRGRSRSTASTRKRAPRRTTTKPAEGHTDA